MAKYRHGAPGMRESRDVRAVNARAPAKINLGLEILGKRRDGYHEIRSVLAMIDMHDDLRFQLGRAGGGGSLGGVPTEDNLIDRAIGLVQSRSTAPAHVGYGITKRIPIAAGLGGASSDAAATLSAVNHLLNHPLRGEELPGLAARLGSDVPFFLGAAAAVVRGTGTQVETIPTIRAAVLLIVPQVTIPRKTAALYERITSSNYTSGHRIERTVRRMRAGLFPEPSDLGNAFTAPLYDLLPSIAILPDLFRESGCARFGLSGAGPSHYALLDPAEMPWVTSQIGSALDPALFRLYQTSLLPEQARRLSTA